MIDEQCGITSDQCGINVQTPDDSDKIIRFSLFFTIEILKHIKSEMNHSAGTTIEKLRRANKLKPNSV